MSQAFESHQIAGAGRGKLLGFPTVNLEIPASLELAHGIYAAQVVMDGKQFLAGLHYGPVPTFGVKQPSLEVFIIDANDTDFLSNAPLNLVVTVGKRLRPIIKFDDEVSLKRQIAQDIAAIRDMY